MSPHPPPGLPALVVSVCDLGLPNTYALAYKAGRQAHIKYVQHPGGGRVVPSPVPSRGS